MKKVDLDKEFEKWKTENLDKLQDKFNDINGFLGFVEECWQDYQNENGLIDKSNDDFK